MIRKLSIITNRRGFLKEKKVRFCLHGMVKYGEILNVESGRQPQIRITAPGAAKTAVRWAEHARGGIFGWIRSSF